MTVGKMKGQAKETTGKLTGDKEMQFEGTLEKGAARVKGAIGYLVDTVTSGANTVAHAIGDVFDNAVKTVKKIF